MEQTKTVPNKFGLWDYPLLIKYLEDMASQGWLLTKYHEKTLDFAATEPKNVKFAVTFFREYNYAGHTPPEDLVYMWEVLETDGWHNVTHNHYMQIFYNEDENCTPFHTDATVQLANFDMLMQESLLKKWQYSARALLTYLLIRGASYLHSVQKAQLETAELYSLLAFAIPLAAFLVYEMGYNFFRRVKYQQWHRQAVVLAQEENEFMTPYENNFYDSLHFSVTLVFCLVFVAMLFLAGSEDVNIFGSIEGPLYALDNIHMFILSRILTSVKFSRFEDEGVILPVREKYPTSSLLFGLFVVMILYILSFSARVPRIF